MNMLVIGVETARSTAFAEIIKNRLLLL